MISQTNSLFSDASEEIKLLTGNDLKERRSQILIIDDEPVARLTLEGLLSPEPYDLHFAENGIQGLALAASIQPDVILLDVMMPNMNGFELCKIIRSTYALNEVPILFITTLDDRNSRLAGIRAGADDFLSKPFDGLELVARLRGMTRLNRYRLIAEQRRALENLNTELVTAYDKTIEGWSAALDLRDKETEGHTQRVTAMTVVLAQAHGLSDEQIKHMRRGALLHDIGKLGIPDSILLKPGKLTDQEWHTMRQHPVLAYQWLSQIAYLRAALDIPYCHHEKWDGTGYPRGLKGEEIPIAARIFAITDVWDALTSDRPYRQAAGHEQAYQYILSQSGLHFDPQIVELFTAHKDELKSMSGAAE
jgi:putative two-component system response regulator